LYTFQNVCKLPAMRRTKEEAARTRDAIVEAALACFDRHGIGGTTLDQIAAAAGVTKGAIYWHFKGKREIFEAIRDAIAVPLIEEADTTLLHGGEGSALTRLEAFLAGMLSTLQRDRRRSTALGIMQFKCEYVDGLEIELVTSRRNTGRLIKAFQAAYTEAREAGEVRACVEPKVAAAETMMFFTGLVRLWLLDKGTLGLRGNARLAIAAHLQSKRA
jgi:TetR/AcrR family acrAB operon transcriptional repressor